MTKTHAATSTDVAKRAGVSQATVSLVFSGREGRIRVSEATRERVLAVAAELGYSPHPLAQALRRRQSGIIAFVPRFHRTTPTAQPVPFLLSIHLARAALHHGFHVIEVGAEDDPVLAESGLASFLRRRRVDGVIFDGPEHAHDVEQALASGLPVVQIIRPQLSIDTATITVDPAPGMTAAVDHLVVLGHRAIAFVGRGASYPIDRMRLESFLAALARHAITPPDDDLLLVPTYALEAAYGVTRAVLARARRPTALIAAGDNLALGVLRALQEARVHVPDAMSLISYDDAFAADLYPPLTSIVQPLEEVGERAIAVIAALLDPAKREDGRPTRIMLPTRFIARASTGPPARDGDGESGTDARAHRSKGGSS